MGRNIQLQYAMKTETGDRNVNEDYVNAVERENQYCFVVCDGLGGHGLGDVASKFVAETIGDEFDKSNVTEDFLPTAFEKAQMDLIARKNELGVREQMKTTVAALAISEDEVFVGHVGDSRVYVFAENEVKYRTLDHSIPQMKVLLGEIEEKDIRKHPERNVILRAMGSEWDNPMYEIARTVQLSECQAFLLCSDGFWEYIDETEMVESLKQSETVGGWLENMTSIVCRNGKNENMDNYSAIAIWREYK